MRKQFGLLAFLLCTTLTLAQETYTTWSGHKNVILNTSASGARILSSVRAFPVLVRLGAADSNIFSQSVGRGADLRFTKANNTTRLPHQIERWDSAGKSAAVWVLVDTIRGNINNQSFRMHWGKTGAADSSNGSSVFGTGNGFQAVWHMNNGGTGNELDATSNGLTLSAPTTASAQPTNYPAGAIGLARTFATGSSQYLIALNSANGALNFPYGGPFTLSAWYYPTTTGQRVIVGKSDFQYALQTNGGQSLEGCDVNTSWDCAAGSTPSTSGWEHFAFVRASVDTGNIYVNGVFVSAFGAGPGTTRNTNFNVTVGAMISGTTPGTNTGATGANGTKSRYWDGAIDEVRLENAARDSNWILLEFQNQQTPQTLVTLLDTVPALAVPPIITTNPSDRNLNAGDTARFNVAATGSGTLTFKWVKNNTDTVRTTSGVTSDTLKLSGVLAADNNATYKCVVRNAAGQAVSASATLGVTVGILPGVNLNSLAITTSGSSVLFNLPAGISGARIAIVDLWGRTVWNQTVGGGVRQLRWNGTNTKSQTNAPGIYLVRINLLNDKGVSVPAMERKVFLSR